MFFLAELKDTIRIPPETFHLKLLDAVKDEINRKLANKVRVINSTVISFFFFFEMIKEKPNKSINVNGLMSLDTGFTERWPMHRSKGHNQSW